MKKSHPDKTFQNVQLFALSKGIRNFLTKKNLEVPEKLSVIVPRRASDKNCVAIEPLRNHTDGMVIDLPIENLHHYNFTDSYISLNVGLTKSNAVIAHPIIRNFLHKATPISVVFSNLPGPDFQIGFGNFTVKNIVFYSVMNGDPIFAIGSTSFNGKIGFGIIADRSTFQSSNDLNELLFEIVNEIKIMKLND